MKFIKIFSLSLILFLNLFSQKLPIEENNFNHPTTYIQLKRFIIELDNLSKILKVIEIGKSVEEREIFALLFSNNEFGKDESKLKLLFFAQQHGNEQSGKEASLFLARELLKKENQNLFDKIDLAIIPQVNPDGSEVNKRRNANNIDLNRNHLLLEEPEVRALHQFFNKYQFEVTLDVHEYYPYSDDWRDFGFFKRADEQLGLLSNINISRNILNYSKEKVLPYISKWLNDKNYTFNEYVVGGPPNKERLRHSTVDINDGRQSLGIQGTLSFILEGKNGKDNFIENIEYRMKAQAEAMMGLIKFCYENAEEIKQLIRTERKNLLNDNSPVSVQMDHFNDGRSFSLPVTNVVTQIDTIIEIKNYNPLIKNILEVSQPDAYLVPKACSLTVGFMNNHNIFYHDNIPELATIQIYQILSIDTIEIEGEKFGNPQIEINEVKISEINSINYYIVPLNQLKRIVIVLAFEPQSMLGLRNYEKFKNLLQAGKKYPIFRLLKD
jgi:hypothetical protein